MLCFREFLAAKVLKKRGKEYHEFLWKVLSHSAEKFGRGSTLLCCVSKNFWQRKSFEKVGEGVLQFSVESFLSHSVEIFGRGTTFLCCVSENFWQRKNFEKEGEYQEFPGKLRCLTVSKNLVGEQPFCAAFKKFSGS